MFTDSFKWKKWKKITENIFELSFYYLSGVKYPCRWKINLMPMRYFFCISSFRLLSSVCYVNKFATFKITAPQNFISTFFNVREILNFCNFFLFLQKSTEKNGMQTRLEDRQTESKQRDKKICPFIRCDACRQQNSATNL